MTDTDPARSTPPAAESAPPSWPEPGTSQPAEDPGYLIETGQAAGEDGSVVPRGRPGISAPRWTTAARAWLTSKAAHRTRPATRTQAAADPQHRTAGLREKGRNQSLTCELLRVETGPVGDGSIYPSDPLPRLLGARYVYYTNVFPCIGHLFAHYLGGHDVLGDPTEFTYDGEAWYVSRANRSGGSQLLCPRCLSVLIIDGEEECPNLTSCTSCGLGDRTERAHWTPRRRLGWIPSRQKNGAGQRHQEVR
jgi:hypothetical protein